MIIVIHVVYDKFLITESNISLPKYQPKVKTLDDFLKKLKSRNTDSIKPTVSIKRFKHKF